MNINDLPRSRNADELHPLVFTSINDVPENPRLGLGYHQLYDPTKFVPLIARLPDVVRTGDVVTLFWDNAQVQQYALDQSAVDKGWLSFSVAPAQISGANDQGTVYYTLYDPAGDETRSSEPRTIKVNRRVPGGLDPDTSTGFNENLEPAVITPPIIDSVDTPVTVTVPIWENIELGDELTVMWNGIRVAHPPLTTIAQPVVVPIPKAVLEQGGSNTMLPVLYEIRDIVDNYSLPSRTAFANVAIDPNAFDAPTVVEANPLTMVLDLAALNGADATVNIAFYPGIATGDEVTLIWVGRVAGSDIPLPLPPQTVVGALPVFKIANAHLQSIAGGSAIAYYEVRNANVLKGRSKRTAITLTGLPIVLIAPTITGVTGPEIDLDQFLADPVPVLIAAYRGKRAGDKISLIWAGTQENGTPANYTADHIVLAGEENAAYTFPVGRVDNLEPLRKGSLRLHYQVVFTGDTSPVDSDISNYTVKGSPPVFDDFDNFDNQLPVLIQAGGRISRPLMDIEFVSGLGDAGFPTIDSLPENPGPITLPTLHVCYRNPIFNPGTQTIRLDLKRDYRSVECDIHGPNGLITISLLNSSQSVIETITPPNQTNYHLRSTTAQPIRYIQILADQDWARFDNFKLGGGTRQQMAQHTQGRSNMDLKHLITQLIALLQEMLKQTRPDRGIESTHQAVYPAPRVRPVNAFEVLQPDVEGVDNVQIIVDYDGMPNTDILSFYWDGDTTSIPPVQADARPKYVSVPRNLVIAAANKTINVIYLVTDDANPGGVASTPRSQVVEGYTPPPPPVLTEAVGGVLDVSKLTANAHMTVARWGGQAVGQKLWLTVTSTPQIAIENWNPLNITTLGTQSRQFALDKLKTLTNGSTFKLTLQYSPVGSNEKLPFSEASYIINQEPEVRAIAITRVEDSRGNLIPDGGTTTDTSVTISGTVTFADLGSNSRRLIEHHHGDHPRLQ